MQHADDLEDLLAQAMLTDFNLQAEDGSPRLVHISSRNAMRSQADATDLACLHADCAPAAQLVPCRSTC